MILADLHVHSRLSPDAVNSLGQIEARCKSEGIDVAAVADHDACAVGLIRSACLIAAEEVMTNLGEIIGLFLKKEIAPGLPEEVVERIHAQDGLAVLPHPFKGHRHVEYLGSIVDAIEVANGRTDRTRNRKALELALQLQKPMVAGSDAHFPFEVGQCAVWLDANSLDSAALKQAILSQMDPTRILVRRLRLRTKHLSYLLKMFRRSRGRPLTNERTDRD